MEGALEGIRVVDLSQVVSGPVATRSLADQGADVVKVEPPSGDTIRQMGGGGIPPAFSTINRSKRSVKLDLKDPAAIDAVKALASDADVFVQNYRPGAIDRMGLGEPALRALNPRLVYVSISGYGETGPYADRRVYDPIMQGMSGLAEIQGGVGGRPALMRVIIPDKVTALTAAQSITAALFARERTGKGQHLRLAMLDATLAFTWPEGMVFHTFQSEKAKRFKPVARRDLVFETRDGHMIASTVAFREWKAFCEATGRTEWLEDPRFQDGASIVVHSAARLELMAEVLETRTTAEWLERLSAADVPCGPVLSRDDLHEHPQIVENGILVESEHPVVGPIREPRPAERFDATPSRIRRPAPELGQHTEEVLREAGLPESAVAHLAKA
jgi:crotonobetainyl-CoA:carnitine CoA-transferase CaiB-like acyl-CoA transferase